MITKLNSQDINSNFKRNLVFDHILSLHQGKITFDIKLKMLWSWLLEAFEESIFLKKDCLS